MRFAMFSRVRKENSLIRETGLSKLVSILNNEKPRFIKIENLQGYAEEVASINRAFKKQLETFRQYATAKP